VVWPGCGFLGRHLGAGQPVPPVLLVRPVSPVRFRRS